MDPEPNAFLLPGERILWSGRPLSGINFTSKDAFLIPFSLLWGGFALFWNVSVWRTNAPLMFRLFGLPFLAMGIYVTFGRFVWDARLPRKLSYFVTNRRVLIAKTGSSSIDSLDIKRLPNLDLQERSDGTGTINFRAPTAGGRSFQTWTPSSASAFVRIAGVRSVYELIDKQTV